MFERGRERLRRWGQRANKDFVGSASSVRSFPYQGHMSAAEENREGRRAVEYDSASLTRLGPQTKMLKGRHQQLGTPNGSHMSERVAGVSTVT